MVGESSPNHVKIKMGTTKLPSKGLPENALLKAGVFSLSIAKFIVSREEGLPQAL
jgi:hypothetical protein